MHEYIRLHRLAQLFRHTSLHSVVISKEAVYGPMEVTWPPETVIVTRYVFRLLLRHQIPGPGTRCSLPLSPCYILSEATDSSSCKTMVPWD